MSDQGVAGKTLTSLSNRAAGAALDALWRQWGVVNPLLATHGAPRRACLIDPEALVLGSLALADREPRLVDLLAWWAQRVSGLLSVQRMRTLESEFDATQSRLGWFAYWAVNRGGDRRWTALAEQPRTAEPRPGKGPEVPRLDDRATLKLKLRAGLGVGVKADLLAYLICLGGEARSATEIAEAIGYTDKTVRIAVRDLGLAEFVEETRDYPARYATPPEVAQSFLVVLYGRRTPVTPPRWCYWAQVLSFLLRVAEWESDARLSGDSYLASSRARDLFAEYEAAFRALGLRMPRPEPHPGAAYLEPFDEFVTQLGSWVEASDT